ncbi:hypothetical protein [Oceaniglobus roseus]|uniref:hypothetical protein n=1 Tax=Oceaniglobus roseus TaxID=1737570 RepID=UPI0012FFF083|nr:hypothetical protein [Kandeliimicrobium roseum]
MTPRTFFRTVVCIFALFGTASVARAILASGPELMASQIALLVPVVLSVLLLVRLTHRAARAEA